jgi:hypothetical protein
MLGVGCQREELLSADWIQAMRLYAFAVNQLRIARHSGEQAALEGLLRLCKEVKDKCRTAKKRMDTHVADHGCLKSRSPGLSLKS